MHITMQLSSSIKWINALNMVWILISRNRRKRMKKMALWLKSIGKISCRCSVFSSVLLISRIHKFSLSALMRQVYFFSVQAFALSFVFTFLAFFPPVINSLMSLLLFGNLLYKSLIFQKVSANSTYFSHPSLVGFRIEKLFVLIDFINVNRY